MGNEYFEARGVSRGEFEALKRFGDYKELADGTLMRMEGNKEFRIYCEDSGWLRGRGVILTSGFCRVLSEAHDRVVEKLKKDPDYLNRLREKFKNWQVESQLPASTTASSSVLPDLSPTQS